MKVIVDFKEPGYIPRTIVNDGVAHKAEFDTRPGTWTEITIPFGDFQPTIRGYRPWGVGPLGPGRIRQRGFLIGDKVEGPFSLEIAWVKAYTGSE